MGIIVRRDVSSAKANEATEAPTQVASNPSTTPATSESPEETISQTPDASSTETNPQPITTKETEPASTTESIIPSPNPTTVEQQQPTTSEDKQTEQQPINYNTPAEDTTQNINEQETPLLDNTLASASLIQATPAVTSTLPTSISISLSSSASTIVETVSPISSCSSDTSPACTNNNDTQLSGGAIAGVVVGALAVLAILCCGCLLFKRRRQNSKSQVPPRQSFLFMDEKPVLESELGSDLPSNTSVYQSQNTFGVHSQPTIPKYESPAMTISSQITDSKNKEATVTTALYPPIKRNKSNEYIQNNRVSVTADTDNYTQSALKLFQPPSRALSPVSNGRESELSNHSKRSIYRPSLHQSEFMEEIPASNFIRRESTIDPYNKPMSLWDDSLKDDAYNPDFEWSHDNGYIQPPLYRP